MKGNWGRFYMGRWKVLFNRISPVTICTIGCDNFFQMHDDVTIIHTSNSIFYWSRVTPHQSSQTRMFSLFVMERSQIDGDLLLCHFQHHILPEDNPNTSQLSLESHSPLLHSHSHETTLSIHFTLHIHWLSPSSSIHLQDFF